MGLINHHFRDKKPLRPDGRISYRVFECAFLLLEASVSGDIWGIFFLLEASVSGDIELKKIPPQPQKFLQNRKKSSEPQKIPS